MATVLYSYWRSSCSWRVRIVLAYKNIPYDYKGVHLVRDGGQHKKLDYADMNPMQQVPVLVIDGQTFSQSTAIVEYLEETRSEPALLPKDAVERARVREIIELIGSGIQPLQNLPVLDAMGDRRTEWAQQVIERGFKALEVLLQKVSGKHAVGDTVTLADVFIVPQIGNARRFGLDLAPFPTILRVEQAVADHPAFKAAVPAAQPDAE